MCVREGVWEGGCEIGVMPPFSSGMVGRQGGPPGDRAPSRGPRPPLPRGGGAVQAARQGGPLPPQQAEDTPPSQATPAQHHQCHKQQGGR